MIKFLLTVICLFASGALLSQAAQADSLLQRLDKEKEDSSKADIYAQLGKVYIDLNNTVAINYFTKSSAIYNQLHQPLKVANNNFSIGYCYLQKGDFTASLNSYLQAAATYTNLHDDKRLANTFMSIVNVYSYNNDEKKIDEYYAKAKALIETMKDSVMLDDLYDQKGMIFGERQQYDSSLAYHKKGYELARATNQKFRIVSGITNIGLAYKNLKKNELALHSFDSALLVLFQLSPDPSTVSIIYNNIAATYAQMGKSDSAKHYFNKSINLSTSAGLPSITLENFRNLSDMYGQKNDYENEATYLKKYYALKDSLYKSDTKNQLTELEANYRIGQKNVEISQQQGEVQKQKGERDIFLIIALATVVLLLTSVFFYNRIKNNNRLLVEKNILINGQKEKLQQTLQHLKDTQAQLVQSEKMASLGELTAGIAHEIQNPLNFVNNFAELNTELIAELEEEAEKGNLEDVLALLKDVKDNEQKINFHGKRASSIVKGMLQHSRKNTGQKETTDVNALCDEYLRLSYHGLRAKNKEFNAEFVMNFDESLPKIAIIPQDVGRVLLNLFNNAFYAVNEKRKAGLEGYKPTVAISTKKLPDRVEIVIEDNGCGIPQKIADKIFQPFFTTKPTGQGTGLGLSLSYDIITKEHNGNITVTSEENKFTRFTITIPY